MTSPGPHIAYFVGAQKAGTSWLHDYLSGHPDCHVPAVKELHYFDDLYGPYRMTHAGQRLLNVARLEQKLARSPEDAIPAGRLATLQRLLAMHDGPGAAGYLSALLAERKSEPVAADVTPAYALVGRRGFSAMREVAAKTRFVFVMRDPVDRLWSALRMQFETLRNRVEIAREDFLARWRIYFAVFHKERSDYRSTVEALDAAVPEGDRLYLFFEDLFAAQTLRRLTTFLGLPAHGGQTGRRVRQGLDWPLPAKLADELAQVLAAQYAFIAQRFGRLPDRWLRRMNGALS